MDHRAVSEREKALTAEVEELKLQLQSSAKVHDEEQAALRRKIEEQQETVRQAQVDCEAWLIVVDFPNAGKHGVHRIVVLPDWPQCSASCHSYLHHYNHGS